MKNLLTLLLIIILMTREYQQECKEELWEVQNDLKLVYPDMFKTHNLEYFANQAEMFESKDRFQFGILKTNPAIMIIKKRNYIKKEMEVLDLLTKSYGNTYKPFTFSLSCIESGSTTVLFTNTFSNFNNRLNKLSFYRRFVEQSNMQNHLLILKDFIGLFAKMEELNILSQGVTYSSEVFDPVEDPNYLFRPNILLFDNLFFKNHTPIILDDNFKSPFMSPEERRDSQVDQRSGLYSTILTFLIYENKSHFDNLSQDKSYEFLSWVKSNNDSNNNQKVIDYFLELYNTHEKKNLYQKIINGGLEYDFLTRASPKIINDLIDQLLINLI
jgi:hypothetical protein